MSRLCCRRLLLGSSLVKQTSARYINAGVPLKNQENVPESKSRETAETQSISKAMLSYLERATAHQTFITELEEEFVLGKRHLANMMGRDPDTFTLKDMNEAIRYLFPSGLTRPKAGPVMRPPEELYPKQKDAQFDKSGRPHHPFFYTSLPNFYFLCHEVMNKLDKLNTMYTPAEVPRSEESLSYLKGTKWIDKTTLETRLLERLSLRVYNEWVTTMDRLASHQHFEKEMEFMKQYRQPLAKLSILPEPVPVLIEPDGRKTVVIKDIRRKRSKAHVTVRMPGTGLFTINGDDFSCLKMVQSREVVISPLQMTGLLNQVDVEVEIEKQYIKLGETNTAHLMRFGIAHALVALGAEVEPLRIAGYLTVDVRKKERKKPGRIGARAKWTWCKR